MLVAQAKGFFERAIEIDPGSALPHRLLAQLIDSEWANDLSASPQLLDRAYDLAQRSVELAENESLRHVTFVGALISIMARSNRFNQRPDKLMQDHHRQIDETLLRRTAGPYIAPFADSDFSRAVTDCCLRNHTGAT
jgi:hypothetical protein